MDFGGSYDCLEFVKLVEYCEQEWDVKVDVCGVFYMFDVDGVDLSGEVLVEKCEFYIEMIISLGNSVVDVLIEVYELVVVMCLVELCLGWWVILKFYFICDVEFVCVVLCEDYKVGLLFLVWLFGFQNFGVIEVIEVYINVVLVQEEVGILFWFDGV